MEEIKRIKLFAGCDDASIQKLLSQPCRRQSYSAGKIMFNAGDPCRSLMILVEGELQTRQYVDKNGSNQTIVELVVDGSRFTGESKSSTSSGTGSPPIPASTPPTADYNPTETAATSDDYPF